MGSNLHYCDGQRLRPVTAQLPDLCQRADIETFVGAFYDRLLLDPELGPIFLDVANIDLSKHLPLICDYWQKLLLGENCYHRHTMNMHRAVDLKRPFTDLDFQRWLGLFTHTMQRYFAGPTADKAITIATRIAGNMQERLAEQHAAIGMK